MAFLDSGRIHYCYVLRSCATIFVLNWARIGLAMYSRVRPVTDEKHGPAAQQAQDEQKANPSHICRCKGGIE